MTIIRSSWLLFVIVFLASLYAMSIAPDGMKLPIHWNLSGEVDNEVSAKTALWIMPAIILGILLFMSVLAYVEPRKDNLQKSNKARSWIVLAITMFMSAAALGNVAKVMGYDIMSFRLLMSGIMLLFIILGNFLPKLRSNFYIGIRTPWTLSSEENWKLTHRLGGRLFMICGVVGFVITLFAPSDQMMSYLALAVLLPCVIIPIAYSWYLFRQENK